MFTDIDENEYIFTFGFGHEHKNKFISILSTSPENARVRMISRFGKNWSMQYDAPNAREKAGVDKFNLTEIE